MLFLKSFNVIENWELFLVGFTLEKYFLFGPQKKII